MLWNHQTFEDYCINFIRSVIHIHMGLLVIVLLPKWLEEMSYYRNK